MKIKVSLLHGWLLVLTLLSAARSFGQYTQGATNNFAPGPNVIEKSATAMTMATFKNSVAVAWTNSSGGVLNFPTSIATGTTIYRGNYGNGKRLQITSSVSMQNITAGTFILASAPNGTTSSANQSDYTLTVGLFDTNSGLPVVGEVVKELGFVVLSRTAAGYPLDLRVTATFSDNSTQVVTSPIGSGAGVDDTFFGFTAGPGLAISSIRLQSFVPSTSTPVADRIGWDDFGFVAGPSASIPQPQIVNVTPPAYAIVNATNGIHFEALTYEAIGTNNISLILNSNNVSGSLVFTGNPTNYSVSYSALLPDQEYNMTINVTNSSGVATLNRTFYTHTAPFVLYDSEGFTNDTLYPLGPLQAVTHGRATWIPNATEPAQIVSVPDPQAKVLERLGTGASRVDVLGFPPVSSGTITMEFDAFVSTTNARTIDICLQPVSGGTTMASFLAWGEVTNKLGYFDNVNWLPITDLPGDWHHVKIINYLSGPAGGKYDVLVNNVAVGQKLPWRNAPVGSVFNQFRIQTQNTAAFFEYGRIDNLVITAGPEDPNAFPPPVIVNVTPLDRSIIRPEDGVHFEVTSALPTFTSNVVLRLNDVPVSLTITGATDHLTASHTQLTVGNYSMDIRATNASGFSTVTRSFIATDESWLVHPADGWAARWEWTTGMTELRTASPLDVTTYLRLDTTGAPRNLMRQYQSGTVDINQPHFIRWKFRLIEPDFDSNFTVFNDRVHFFAHPVSRIGASTTTGNSWAIMAAGAESVGAVGGKTFWVFDNVEGNGTFNAANQVDTHVPLRPDHVYSFEVLVRPQQRTYSVVIVDQTDATSFTSVAPHKFRDIDPLATHTFLHFGVQASSGSLSRAFDLDSVSVTQATIPVTLLNPARSGSNFTFSFASQTGAQHAVQYNGDLGTSIWTTLQSFAGDGTQKTVTHTNPPVGPLYYRINSSMP